MFNMSFFFEDRLLFAPVRVSLVLSLSLLLPQRFFPQYADEYGFLYDPERPLIFF